ncbi:MAG: VacB/RNase II family 3'-5' exoribonuclease [Planctomycetes bacterium]|nr:VacB/RNase II family 3'-5' exoribonuclease [Planctomycetota bacterium]MDA0947403.1 ribonuclease R [Planctomycetota bacterium]
MGKGKRGKDREGGGSFGSFRDLQKARGEESTEAPRIEGRGWTLEDEDGEVRVEEADLESLPDPDADARARIGRRPRADGPMVKGPACYREDGADELELLRSFRIRTVFLRDVLAEVQGLPADPSEEDMQGRADLRGELIYTIDGDDAKDHDDAISIRELGGGRVEIGVHIADVGHYVRPGTVLDDEALARGTSVYLPDQVVPMLPEELSNGLCSLVEGRDRLAYSVHMVFDALGERESYRCGKSVLRSVRRCTYKEVQALLDGREAPAELEPLRASLEAFASWTRRQQSIRDAKGSLRIQSSEKKFLFDADGEVERIVDAEKVFSMTLIEETALAANQAVGDFFRERGLPTIYRVHPEKDPEEVAAVAELLLDHGIRVPDKERLTGRDVGRLIRQARRRPNAEALIGRIMGLVERAVYEVKDHEDVATHFGLAREAYLHFTSPIRRYPDLMVHRWLHEVQSGEEGARAELSTEALLEDLNQTAAHASMQAETAEMAETAVKDLKVCQFMEPHIGERLEARVVRVSRGGLEVHLLDFNVGGFLPARSMGQRPRVEGATLTVRVGKRVLSFTEGYAIRVEVKAVDFIRLQVLLELAT